MAGSNKDKGFGNRLKHLRKRRHLTQTEAAPLIGLSYKALQDHEGGRWPNRKNQQKYLDFYKCDKKWFLTGEGKPFTIQIELDDNVKTSDELDIKIYGPDGQLKDHSVVDSQGKEVKGEKVSVPAQIDPFAHAVSALKDIFDSGDPNVKSAILANINASQFTAHLLTRYENLESRLHAVETILNEYGPPEGKEERRRAWIKMKKAIGL